MVWMDEAVDVNLTCAGGCCAACQRRWAGETCYFEKYTGPGLVAFGFDMPGDMLAFAVSPKNGWVLTKGAFVAGSGHVKVSSKWEGCCASEVGGEGHFLVKVYTDEPMGMFWAGNFGEIHRHEIPPGKTLWVDNGLFFAAHENVKFNLAVVGGVTTCCCGGEGIVMAFHGPAVVYTQSRDPELWSALNAPPNAKMQEQKMAGAAPQGGPPPQ